MATKKKPLTPRPDIVIQRLLLGGDVKLPKFGVLRLFKPGETIPTMRGDAIAPVYWLGSRMLMGDQPIYVGMEAQFTHLLDIVAELTEEQWAGMVATIVLTKEHRKYMI